MANVRYFATINGQAVQLKDVGYIDPKFIQRPIKESDTGKRVHDGASVALRCFAFGTHDGERYFADRKIFRKSNPSNHKCDSRCVNAKGHNCECSCGGKYHGSMS